MSGVTKSKPPYNIQNLGNERSQAKKQSVYCLILQHLCLIRVLFCNTYLTSLNKNSAGQPESLCFHSYMILNPLDQQIMRSPAVALCHAQD